MAGPRCAAAASAGFSREAAEARMDALLAAVPQRYTREQAAFPLPWVKAHKIFPAVGRVDNAYGDRNLVCACPSVDSYK